MIMYAIEELEAKKKNRFPSRKEVLDYLFSGSRQDPEAQDLERRISHLLTELLDNW